MPSEPTDGEPVEHWQTEAAQRILDLPESRWAIDFFSPFGGGATGAPHYVDTDRARMPRFVLFPRWTSLRRKLRAARYETTERIVAAWRTLRHGVDEEDDW